MDTLYFQNKPCKHCGGKAVEYIEDNIFCIQCEKCNISITKEIKKCSIDFVYGVNVISEQWQTSIIAARKIWNREVDK